MTYEETLEWMYGCLPMYQQKGKAAYNGKLDNILAFSDQLGNPHRTFKSIHVAGTNGKGSCSHMLASVLQEAGYKTGLYTSPHLKDFRERIKINGKEVSEEFVVQFIREHKDFLERRQLSFFEMTVGMAFQYFASKAVDIAIIEVGVGGRLDSTNIITPEVSLITNIGWDHTDLLGDSLEKISKEKAGIIKKGVPVVISEYQEIPSQVFIEVADKMGSPIYFAEKLVQKKYEIRLPGTYQQKNVRGVLTTLDVLEGFEVREEAIVKGLQNVIKNTGLKGRWQVLSEKPKIIADTAHNYDGIKEVLKQIFEQEATELYFVLGFVQDKNLEAILPLLPKQARYYYARPKIRRGLEAEILQKHAAKHQLIGEVYSSVSEALDAARSEALETDLIFVGGSTFTVAEVL